MLELDEDALICDLAEAYGIYDYESLPVQTVATLSIGLRGDSRIKMKMIGAELTRSELLQTVIADYLALILWSKTKDGQKGRNKPKPLRDVITGGKNKKEIVGFSTHDDFERVRQQILSEVDHG